MSFTFRASVLFTRVSFFSLRMRPGFFVPSRWRLPECMRRILPVAVTLKRLAAPRCVFSFIFGFDAFLGITRILSTRAAARCYGILCAGLLPDGHLPQPRLTALVATQ